MRDEIQSASAFLASLLRLKWPSADKNGANKKPQLQRFTARLEVLLGEHYASHWFPERPCRGSAYRCIRINHRMDPLVERAALECGLDDVRDLFPRELTLWVDPREVSYRIGENGSICVLYDGEQTPTTSDEEELSTLSSSPSSQGSFVMDPRNISLELNPFSHI